MNIKLKRIYDPAGDADGFRILVDRMWPRGIKKDSARIDLWEKDIAPSAGLRKWFAHIPGRFPEFARRYEAELAGSAAFAAFRQGIKKRQGNVTLLFGAKDTEHNNAVVLAKLLEKDE